MRQISITTDDGACPAYDFGAGPSVLFYIAGIGMRPAMHAIGECLAAAGYRVLSTCCTDPVFQVAGADGSLIA